MRTTSSIGAIWMKVEVGFKPFPLRCLASLGLLVEDCQMLWGLALVSRMRVASTLVTKPSFVILWLCGALPTVRVLRLFVLVALTLTLEVRLVAVEGTTKLSSVRDIHMNFRQRLGTNRALRAILSKKLIMLFSLK